MLGTTGRELQFTSFWHNLVINLVDFSEHILLAQSKASHMWINLGFAVTKEVTCAINKYSLL